MKQTYSLGGIYLTFSLLIFTLSGYLIHIWLGRSLGPIEYGLYGVIISLMTVINLMQTSGLPHASSKFIAEGNDDPEAILQAALVLQIFITLSIAIIFFISADLLALLLGDARLAKYLRFVALVMPFYGIFAIYNGYYNGLRRFKKQALMGVVYAIAKLVLVVVLSVSYKLYGAIAGFVISPVIALLFGFKVPRVKRLKLNYRKLFIYSMPLVGFAVLSMLQISVDLLFVKALTHKEEEAGYFTASQNIARIPYYALSAFALILFPGIARAISREGKKAASRLASKAIRYLILLLLPLCALIAATSTQLVELLYGYDYQSAAQPLFILALAYIFVTLAYSMSSVLNGLSRPGLSMLFSACGVGVTVLACIILIPAYGMNGAAIATGVGGFIMLTLTLVSIYKLLKIEISIFSCMKILIASFLMGFSLLMFNPSLALLGVGYVLAGVLYLIILLILGEFTGEDIKQIRKFIPPNTPIVGSNAK